MSAVGVATNERRVFPASLEICSEARRGREKRQNIPRRANDRKRTTSNKARAERQ